MDQTENRPPGSITEEICYGCFLPDLAGFTALLALPEGIGIV